MTFEEYIRDTKQNFTFYYNDFIVEHTIQITNNNDCVTIKILDIRKDTIAFITFDFNIQNAELHIKFLKINDEYTRQSIGTFLILLSLELVYRYTNIIQLSARVITVTLDDMSIRNHVARNIYLLAGFHYDQRDLPEMLSSLIHTIRICQHYFKSKSKLSKLSKIPTIFNKNHNYFSGGKMKIEPIKSPESRESLRNNFKKSYSKIITSKVHASEKHEHDIIYRELYRLQNIFSVLKLFFSKGGSRKKVLMNGGKRNSTKLYTKKRWCS